jgi:Pretoxin HINT domain
LIWTRSRRARREASGTSHHLYWDATTRAWTRADHLHAGDRVQTTEGHTATIVALHRHTGTMVTYNLTVDHLHTYYVEAGTTPVLVHNSSCPVNISKGRWQHIWERHVIRGGKYPNKSKFFTTSKPKIQKMINRALDGQTDDGAYYYEFPNPIGQDGAGDPQSFIRVVVRGGQLITAFPSGPAE